MEACQLNSLHTKFLTGLRGYSALAVFLVHSGGAGIKELGKYGERFVTFGKYGVVSFFVLSALTLSISISRSQNFSYSHYITHRLSRIVPVYFLLIIFFWLIGGQAYYLNLFNVNPRDFWDLVNHLSFFNVFDPKYKSTAIGVEWTVPIEMWTYLFIPFLYFSIANKHPVWRWGVFLLALIISLKNGRWYETGLERHWAIDSYLYCFIGGIIAYSYLGKLKLTLNNADLLVAIFIAIILLLSIMKIKYHEQYITLIIIGLILSLSKAGSTRLIFENRLITFIGNISFPFICFTSLLFKS